MAVKNIRSWMMLILSVFLAGGGLAACSSPAASVDLPLANGKPTFLYFYTEN